MKMYIKHFLFLLLCIVFSTSKLTAQEVPVSTESGVYIFLNQMSLQYNFTWKDLIKPVNRNQIKIALAQLSAQPNLTKQEKQTCLFYYQAFADKPNVYFYYDSIGFKKHTLYTGIHYQDSGSNIHVRPIIGGYLSSNTQGSYRAQIVGVNVWGTFNKKIDYLFSFQDITLSGKGVPGIQQDLAAPQSVNVGGANLPNDKNYNALSVTLSYRLKKGFISIGQERFSWGYGENAQIVQSNNAPAAPYVKLNYQPFKWLQFNYQHSWLQSNVIDSNASYPYQTTTYGGVHDQYIPKYYAQHSLTFTPKNGIDLSIGESIVYTGNLNPGYLIPIMYFKSYDNTSNNQNILAGDNGQLFFGFSIRRLIPHTQLYGQLFIDEIRMTQVFSKENRNQLGYQIGFKNNGLLQNRKLTIGLEYTRIRPFVYSNINPVLTYTHHGASMGDWLGNNADRFLAFVQYNPLPKWYNKLTYQAIRKGGAGSTEQQYLANPQPPFLFNPQFNQTAVRWESIYQLLPQAHLQLIYYLATTNPNNTTTSTKYQNVQLGFYFGLY
jgi:hypothetical protein